MLSKFPLAIANLSLLVVLYSLAAFPFVSLKVVGLPLSALALKTAFPSTSQPGGLASLKSPPFCIF